MHPALVSLLVVTLAAAPLIVLTGLGARARGWSSSAAVLAGLAFPLTWALWYVEDERPHRVQDS